MASKGDVKHFFGVRFAWHVPESCCFMDSKGDVKHFFGVRFAWHVPESCCCSSVSQLRLQGISANGSACSRGQKIVVLWLPKVTWSTFSACVLLGMCPNPAAVRVFRNCASKGFLLMVLLAREDKRLLCPNPAAVRVFRNCASKGFLLMVVLAREDKRLLFLPESCCCSSVSQLRLQGISANGSACSRGQKIVVLWIPKVTWSIFSACVLLGMCPNPAAVRVFRNCASKGFLLMVCLLERTKDCCFCPNPAAVRVFRNCASKGFLLMVLLAREDKRLLFYGFQRWREAFFRRAFCLACARILRLFECFATAPPRDFC